MSGNFKLFYISDVFSETPPTGMIKNQEDKSNLSQKIFYISKTFESIFLFREFRRII